MKPAAIMVMIGSLIGYSGCYQSRAPETDRPIEPDQAALVVTHNAQEDTAPSSLAVLDGSGNFLFDLMESLPQGGGQELQQIVLTSSNARLTIPRPLSMESYYVRCAGRRSARLDEFFITTQVVAWIESREGSRFLGLDTGGSTTFDFEIEGIWQRPVLSPQGRHLFVHGEGSLVGIADVNTGELVWTGEIVQGVFTGNDQFFVYGSDSINNDIVIVDLLTGEHRAVVHPEWQLPDTPSWMTLVPEVATDGGVIVINEGEITMGQFFWYLDVDGTWLPLGSPHEEYTEHRFVGFAEDGNVFVYSVIPTWSHPEPSESALLGFDLETGATIRYPSYSGFYGGERLFNLDEQGTLSVTELGQSSDRRLHAFGPAPEPWERIIQAVSFNGQAVVVGLAWYLNRFPEVFPPEATYVVDRDGSVTLGYPLGIVSLDSLGTIVAFTPDGGGFQIGDIQEGASVSVDTEFLGFIYSDS